MEKFDASSGGQLHICFFPLTTQGHTIPAITMAKLFASRGLKTTLVLTPLNAKRHSQAIQTSRETLGIDVEIVVIEFPSAEFGLPDGFESPDHPATTPDMVERFYEATAKLDGTLERVLREQSPDCLVADLFFPWATEITDKLGIPRVVFHGIGFFSLCATLSVVTHQPHEDVESDSEEFAVPNLPGEFKLTRKQIPPYVRRNAATKFAEIYKKAKESEVGCFGVLVNSFRELEPDYADHYSRVLGRRAWHIGPLSMMIDELERVEAKHECLDWLDSKAPGSVVYVCFGSMSKFGDAQLSEIAAGLERSGQSFLWVVNRGKGDWLPGEEGFEERTAGMGLVLRGWAPQVAILRHAAVGAFVTHCGWNSTLEGVAAGRPMVTWPLFAEQFFNEMLVSRVLRIGVEVGAKKWARLVGDFVGREAVERAVSRVMVGEEAEGMRARARALAEMAGKAIEKGGSSASGWDSFVEELRIHSSLGS